jgi:hypothetical protein
MRGPFRSNRLINVQNRSRKVIPVLYKGSMEGYSTKSPLKTRRSALKRTLRKHGFSSTIKKLNVLNVYNKNRNPIVSKIALKDMNYVRKLSHHKTKKNSRFLKSKKIN